MSDIISPPVGPYACTPYPVKGTYCDSLKYTMQTLQMTLLFKYDPEAEGKFHGVPSSFEPSIFFGEYLFGFGLKPI